MRRSTVFALGTLSLLSLLSLAACTMIDSAGSGPTAAGSAVAGLADRYVARYFATFPEEATLEGVPGADHAALTDNSVAGMQKWRAFEDSLLVDLRAVDSARLRGPEVLTYSFLRERLEASVGVRACRFDLWNVSPTYTGWQSVLALVASTQPVGTGEARLAALERARAMPQYLMNEIANLRQGISLGYTAPKGNVRVVIEQMDALLAARPETSPFFSPALRDTTASFRPAMMAVIGNNVRSSIRRYRDFLATEYLPAAREAIGVSANTDGAACYRAAVRWHTSLDMSAADIHQVGLREMEKIQAEAQQMAERSFPGVQPAGMIRTLAMDRRYRFTSRQQIIDVAQAAVDRAEAAMPRYFGIVPKAKVVIQPYAPFQEKNAPGGQYNSPSDDGTRPGTYLINTYQAQEQSRAGGVESTAFHETYPGHHLQIAIAKESASSHPLLRYFSSGAFVEGWALYSERVADEMGLFSGDIDRVGLLSGQALRAARLVVDAGMHELGWTRQQAIDYLIANTGEEASGAVAEVDRYIATPGQATSYMLGSLEIQRLRQEAEQRMGAQFDIRAFHDRVLEDGGVTLAMLRTKIERWMADK
jgi:uncharacterized protein (DUF885 family)